MLVLAWWVVPLMENSINFFLLSLKPSLSMIAIERYKKKTSKFVVVVVWIDYGKKKKSKSIHTYLNMAALLAILKSMSGITHTNN